jgi:SAM-dependent methyltransferase
MKNEDDFCITTDQQIMDLAVNYNAMLYGLIAPHAQGDVLEIGSGIGNFTKKIIDLHRVRSVTCFEISHDCIAEFKRTMLSKANGSKVTLHEGDFNASDLAEQFDFIFSFNVLEHIQDDRKAIDLITRYLKPGARLVLYLPAMNCIYGSIDRELQHYRRYNKSMMCDLFKGLPLHVEKIKYFNSIGALGWFYTNRVLKRRSQSSGMVQVYDRYVFPTMNTVEKLAPTFFGANLLIVAKRKL